MFDPTGQYPKMIYCGDGKTHKIVESPEEEAAVIEEFRKQAIPPYETPPADPLPEPKGPEPVSESKLTEPPRLSVKKLKKG